MKGKNCNFCLLSIFIRASVRVGWMDFSYSTGCSIHLQKEKGTIHLHGAQHISIKKANKFEKMAVEYLFCVYSVFFKYLQKPFAKIAIRHPVQLTGMNDSAYGKTITTKTWSDVKVVFIGQSVAFKYLQMEPDPPTVIHTTATTVFLIDKLVARFFNRIGRGLFTF